MTGCNYFFIPFVTTNYDYYLNHSSKSNIRSKFGMSSGRIGWVLWTMLKVILNTPPVMVAPANIPSIGLLVVVCRIVVAVTLFLNEQRNRNNIRYNRICLFKSSCIVHNLRLQWTFFYNPPPPSNISKFYFLLPLFYCTRRIVSPHHVLTGRRCNGSSTLTFCLTARSQAENAMFEIFYYP